MSTFYLKISSPEGDLFSGEAVSLSLRGAEGDLAVMAHHVPFVSPVRPCDCRIVLEDGSERVGHTDGGILTVSAEKTVLLAGDFCWL